MTKKKSPEAAKGNMRIKIINTSLILAVTAGLVWAIAVYFNFDKSVYTNDAQVEEFISPINTRVGGYIKEIHFTEHQPVRKGDTLIVIDDRELRIASEQAEATYINALASKNVTSSGVHTIENNVAVSEANIAAAKSRLWNAENNYKRYSSLLKDEVVTQQQYDQIKTEYDALKSQYDALVRQKQSTRLSAVEAGSRIGMNNAEIKRAKAAWDMAKLNVSYTVITAPYDGVVGRRTIQEGQLLQPGQSLVSIIRNEQKWVVANYKETQLANLRLGQEVSVKVDAIENKVFKARVTAISQATGARYSAVPVDNSTGNFVKVQQRIPVRIEFTESNNKNDIEHLRAGMNVQVESID
jgi:membrane fusion protein (multidrug efflux system)